MLRDKPRVVRVALCQNIHALLRGSFGRGAETHRAFMVDKGVAGEQVAPASRTGTQTEVVLFAIATAEGIHVEQAYITQRRAADIHAEPDRGRQFHMTPAVRRPTCRIQIGYFQPERGRTSFDAWIAADRCVVGKR